jgi:hypothetical protein
MLTIEQECPAMAPQAKSPLCAGQVLEIRFPAFTPRLAIRSARELTVEIVAGENVGFSDTVGYEAVVMREGLVFVSWREHNGSTIASALDFLAGEAYTVVASANGEFMRLRGPIEIKGDGSTEAMTH